MDEKFTLEQAIIIAATAHEGKVDKAGMPYILHPVRVMQKMKTLHGKMAGVMHDVVEDTWISFEDLRLKGCPSDVLAALECVTKRRDEKGEDGYRRFIARIIASKNALAVELKLNDIADNSDPARLQYLTVDQREKLIARYTWAARELMEKC